MGVILIACKFGLIYINFKRNTVKVQIKCPCVCNRLNWMYKSWIIVSLWGNALQCITQRKPVAIHINPVLLSRLIEITSTWTVSHRQSSLRSSDGNWCLMGYFAESNIEWNLLWSNVILTSPIIAVCSHCQQQRHQWHHTWWFALKKKLFLLLEQLTQQTQMPSVVCEYTWDAKVPFWPVSRLQQSRYGML